MSAALAAHEAIDDRGNLGAIAEVELRQGRPDAAPTMLEAARERLLPVGNRARDREPRLPQRVGRTGDRPDRRRATHCEAEAEAATIGAAPGSELGLQIAKLCAALEASR